MHDHVAARRNNRLEIAFVIVRELLELLAQRINAVDVAEMRGQFFASARFKYDELTVRRKTRKTQPHRIRPQTLRLSAVERPMVKLVRTVFPLDTDHEQGFSVR